MNIHEKLHRIATWLDYQDETLSFGLRSIADAEKLYDHWQDNADTLPEYADEEWFSPTGEEHDRIDLAARRKVVLGYDPMENNK